MIKKDNRQVLSDNEMEELISGLKFNGDATESMPAHSQADADAAAQRFSGYNAAEENALPSAPRRSSANIPSTPSRSARVHADKPLPRQSGLVTFGKIMGMAAMILLSAWLLSSGGKMKLASVTVSAKDRDAVFSAASGNLLSEALVEIHEIPKVYILERNDDPTPVPAQENFTKIEDPERKNYDDTPIDYYKDPTIEVKCWKEKTKGVIFNYAEVTIADPSQFRRKLVHDVVSKKHLDFPSSTFKKMNGVVGMSSDYCAFRSYGTIVQNGNIVRNKVSSFMDLMIVDREANLTYVADKSFADSKYYNSEDLVYTIAFGPMIVNDYTVNTSRSKMTKYPIGEPAQRYPRAAIAQFGYDKHYLLCTVDSPGLTLVDFAEVIQSKGVRFAYNLDGGQTAALMFNNQLFNNVAYGGEREISDIVFFATAIPNN